MVPMRAVLQPNQQPLRRGQAMRQMQCAAGSIRCASAIRLTAYDAHLRSDSNTRTIAHVNRAGLDIRLRKVAFVSGVCCSRQGYLWYSGYSQNSSGEGTHLRAWRVLLVPPLELRVPRLELLVILVLPTSRMSECIGDRIRRTPPNSTGDALNPTKPAREGSAAALLGPRCALSRVRSRGRRSELVAQQPREERLKAQQCATGALLRCR